MQIDMHYYGTYALARAAGLDTGAAAMIATCAQFVDDNVAEVCVVLRDGARVDAEASAHHPVNTANLEAEDQRQVWVPFHFLPGNQGDTYTERLKCRKDSPIARELVAHHLEFSHRSFALALLGITAHVYADTFSHYGFSGVSSRGNKILNDSFEFAEELDPEVREYMAIKAMRFAQYPGAQLLTNIKSWLAETASGALGHGGVSTFPDRPYLVWSFEYESPDAVEGKRSQRDNRVTFLEGAEALHAMFCQFADARPDLCGGGHRREFGAIRENIREVLAVEGPLAARVDAWQRAAARGVVFGREGERFPDYQGLAWNEAWKALDGGPVGDSVLVSPVWGFYQAAAMHRTYVLRELLPKYGLIVA